MVKTKPVLTIALPGWRVGGGGGGGGGGSGVLQISSGGDDRRIFLGLKFLIPEIF